MGNIVVLENSIRSGQRSLHLMSSQPLDVSAVRPYAWQQDPFGLQVETRMDELKLHHLTATWLAREPMWIRFSKWGDDHRRPMAAWALEAPLSASQTSPHLKTTNGGRGSIREAMLDAALLFYGTFGGFWPSVAWVKTWPQGLAVEDAYIQVGEGKFVVLLTAPWAFDGFVLVGGEFNRRR